MQTNGNKSLALPVEIPVPFGKTPRVVFLTLLSRMREEEVAGFRYSTINKNEANERAFKKKNTPAFQGETLFGLLHCICHLTIYFPF